MKLETDINVDCIDLGTGTVIPNSGLEIMEHLKYPFVDSLKTNVDDNVDLPLDSRVDMCIFRIKSSETTIPFLEFLLYLNGNKNDKGGIQLSFPYILSKHSKHGLVEQCSAPLRALFATDDIGNIVKYSGYVYNKRENKCVLFFNNFFESNNDKNDKILFVSSKHRWWWTLSSEIFNCQRMMNYPISDAVISFFNKNPDIMYLKFKDKILESPTACYAGKHYNYVSYMASFGMKKASTRAHFGPYYYFVGFMDSMRHACYSIRNPHADDSRKKHKKQLQFQPHVLADGTKLTVNDFGKHTKGGVARFAVFLGRCRVFFMNGEEDRSELSMYWAKQDPLIMEKLALRDINGDWTRYFNSAYVGEYKFKSSDNKESKRSAGWTVKEYNNQIPLSCHEIDMSNVPDEHDPDYTDYVIL